MIGRLSALIFLSMLSQTIGIPDQIPLTVAEPGENFTLTCPGPEDRTGMFYWFKLKFGYVVQTVASGSFYKVELQGQFNTSRFTVQKRDGVFVLHIKNVSKEDEATYICQAGATYVMKFTHQMFFAVNDHKNQHKSVYVKQSPTTTSVQPGDSVTLQCSLLFKNKTNGVRCPGEHSVYWFKAGYGKSHPSIIYTHNHSSDEQEKRSCDYSLSETIRDSSDNGTYYCAVVTCGKILFGEGTTVETREELCPFVIVSGTLLICCVIVIVALIICRNQRSVCGHCKGDVSASGHADHVISAEDHLNNVDGAMGELNYVALDFTSRKRERWMNNEEPSQDCIYSGMKDYQ